MNVVTALLLAGSAAAEQQIPAQTEASQKYQEALECEVYYLQLQGALQAIAQSADEAQRSKLAVSSADIARRSALIGDEFEQARKAYKRTRVEAGDDLHRTSSAVMPSGKSSSETFKIMLGRTQGCDAKFPSLRKNNP